MFDSAVFSLPIAALPEQAPMVSGVWPWVIFLAFVFVMLALDLGIFHRKTHAVSVREALIWSIVWVAIALTFNLGVYFRKGPDYAMQFLTGYIIEKSLSVDNIFVFVMIFSFFRVPATYQHRVLYWGILGALIMRGLLIGFGTALIHRFEWILYVFGAFLIYTGIKMGLQKDDDEVKDLGESWVMRMGRRVFRVTPTYHGEHFFVKENGVWAATPLFLVLLMVESSDVIFAVDSIPAIFAITTDPFIVFTSNVFAILGLRALYFVLASVVTKFYYLKIALSVILTFVGIKMTIVHWYKIPIVFSLAFIALTLTFAVIASVVRNRRETREKGDDGKIVL